MPPGESRVILANLTPLIISKDSMKEVPVSEAPTTTIRVLLEILVVERSFLVIIESENGASYWSFASLSISTPFLLTLFLSKSSFWNSKFHFLFSICGKLLSLKGVNS